MDHAPGRPSWDCQDCGQPWPCDPARERLKAQYAGFPATTGLYLAGRRREFLIDRPECDPADLHQRFFGWVA